MARIEPAKISYAEKYRRDQENSYNNLLKQGYSPGQAAFAKRPADWGRISGSVNSQMVDNPSYVDTSKGNVFSYSGDTLKYAPKGSTFYTDEDVTEADLTPDLYGAISEASGGLGSTPAPAFMGVAAKYKGLMGSEKGKQIAAADPVKFGGGSTHSLSPDVLSKMWR
jgi:hypothetical protein